MKATGVVRQLDKFNRIVIPKEIRKTMRIKEGEFLEIFLNYSGEIVLKKYSPIADVSGFVQCYAEEMEEVTGKCVLITNREEIIGVSKKIKDRYLNRRIAHHLGEMIENSISMVDKGKGSLEIIDGDIVECSFIMLPIIANGSSFGAVILMAIEENQIVNESDLGIVKTAVTFLKKYVEN